jgi:hypothetical protein
VANAASGFNYGKGWLIRLLLELLQFFLEPMEFGNFMVHLLNLGNDLTDYVGAWRFTLFSEAEVAGAGDETQALQVLFAVDSELFSARCDSGSNPISS